MSGWIALLKRDVMLASRLGGGGFVGVIFFLSLVVLAPFALGPDLNLLARVGPALLWIAALLATLIGLDRLFQADEEDGSLDLMRMGDMPMLLVVLAKGIAHWLTTGLPLTLAAPVLGLLLAIEPKVLGVVMLSLGDRHTGLDLYRRGRGGLDGLRAARRAVAGGDRDADDDSGDDFRRRDRQCRGLRHDGFHHAFDGAGGPVARLDCGGKPDRRIGPFRSVVNSFRADISL